MGLVKLRIAWLETTGYSKIWLLQGFLSLKDRNFGSRPLGLENAAIQVASSLTGKNINLIILRLNIE